MDVAGPTVRPVGSWSAVRDQAGLLDLVDHVQVSEPYSYRPGEIASPEEWFPPLVNRSDVALLAYDSGDRPVGTTAWVTRTLANNAAAITLIRRHGFEVVPGVTEVRHGRARVYLRRRAPRTAAGLG